MTIDLDNGYAAAPRAPENFATLPTWLAAAGKNRLASSHAVIMAVVHARSHMATVPDLHEAINEAHNELPVGSNTQILREHQERAHAAVDTAASEGIAIMAAASDLSRSAYELQCAWLRACHKPRTIENDVRREVLRRAAQLAEQWIKYSER